MSKSIKMRFFKKREPDPEDIKMQALKELCSAAKALIELYPDSPETQQYLQVVHDWAVQRMIDELE